MSRETETEASLVDELLALPTRERRIDFLRSRSLLDPGGLDRLLDTADNLLDSAPGKAQSLAELCRNLADVANAPAAMPRANYIVAGSRNINGDFEGDLAFTKLAHDGYAALGMNVEALRTNVGKMAALLELGRYQETLDTGQATLDSLNDEGYLQVNPTQEQKDLLFALVHQNRGGCLEYMGRYDEAFDAYSSAERLYEALGMTERMGEISSNRGAILLNLGKAREALEAHEATAAIFREANSPLLAAKAIVNLGEAHLRLGNYMRSLEAFEEGRRSLESFETLSDRYLLLRHTADAYMELNLYAEALAAYREAEGLLRNAGMAHDRAQALWGIGSALMTRSEMGEAGSALEEAASLFEEAGNAPMLSGVMLEEAALLSTRGEDGAAKEKAEAAMDLVSGEDWPVQRFYAHLRLADLLFPVADEVEPHLLEARRLTERLSLPQMRYRLNERLGRLRALQGRDREAEELLEAAIGDIEGLRGTVAQENMRASFLRDKTAAYEELLKLHLDRDGEVEARRAFAVAERAKSRALIDLLTGIVGKESARAIEPGMREMFQTMQAELNDIYNQLLTPAEDGSVSPRDLQGRAVELEREIGRLQLRSSSSSETPDMFGVPDSGFDRPPPGATLVAYHVVGDEVLAFVVADDRVRVARDLCGAGEAENLLRRLDAQWDRLGAGVEIPERHMILLEKSARRILSTLYDMLARPLEGFIEGANLIIVPHGPLHQTPFHALFDGERYLIDRFEISYAPSARVFSLCHERTPRAMDSVLAMGVADKRMPASVREARAVARLFPETDALVGEHATVAALEEGASGSGALHLACHGMFRSDNPMFSSLKLHDAWLKAADVVGLDLAGATVALSACETGRSQVVGGDEVLGLTRAFLGAGAATLLVSLWLAHDETTASLMTRWYEKLLGGESPAKALRDAQLEVKERHPHPYYWAPFVLVGKR